jgi:hypothetical protein
MARRPLGIDRGAGARRGTARGEDG